MIKNIIISILIFASSVVVAFDFPTFNEKKTGVPIEVISEGHGRLGDLNVLKILGQECIDAINIVPKKEFNLAVIAESSSGTSLNVIFQDVDRFGKKYVSKIFKCNFDKKLKNIVSVDRG